MMSTMTYTPTDQLPPPPQWMLDEVEAAEQAHLTDLMNQCFTIRTFRKHVLPIYYRYKSATGKIMGDAIEAWKDGQRKQSEYRQRHGYNLGKYGLPLWERDNWMKHPKITFASSYWDDVETKVYNDGDWRPHIYTCPSKKMRQNFIRYHIVEVRKFVAYKTGKVPNTRCDTARELIGSWQQSLMEGVGNLKGIWEILDAWKKMRFKKLSPVDAYAMRFKNNKDNKYYRMSHGHTAGYHPNN